MLAAFAKNGPAAAQPVATTATTATNLLVERMLLPASCEYGNAGDFVVTISDHHSVQPPANFDSSTSAVCYLFPLDKLRGVMVGKQTSSLKLFCSKPQTSGAHVVFRCAAEGIDTYGGENVCCAMVLVL